MENCESNFPADEKVAIDVLERDTGCLFHPFDGVEDGDEKHVAIEDAVSQMHDQGAREIVHAGD